MSDFSEQGQTHRRQRPFPQLTRGFAFFDEAPVLRGDGASVPAVSQVVDRTTGNRVALQNGPLNRSNAPMPGQQRGVITDAAQASPRQRLVADARVRVRGDDEVGAFRNGVPRHDFGVVEHMQRHPRRNGRQCQPVIGRRGDDAGELNAFFFAKRLKYRGSEKTGTDQCAFHLQISLFRMGDVEDALHKPGDQQLAGYLAPSPSRERVVRAPRF